jgi:cytidylate kinase
MSIIIQALPGLGKSHFKKHTSGRVIDTDDIFAQLLGVDELTVEAINSLDDVDSWITKVIEATKQEVTQDEDIVVTSLYWPHSPADCNVVIGSRPDDYVQRMFHMATSDDTRKGRLIMWRAWAENWLAEYSKSGMFFFLQPDEYVSTLLQTKKMTALLSKFK